MDTRMNETSRRNTVLIIWDAFMCSCWLPYHIGPQPLYAFMCSCWLPYHIGPQPFYQVLTFWRSTNTVRIWAWLLNNSLCAWIKDAFWEGSLRVDFSGRLQQVLINMFVSFVWMAVLDALSLSHKHYFFYRNNFVVVKLLIHLALLYQDICFEIWLGSSHQITNKIVFD